MLSRFTNEFKVGLLAIVAVVVAIWGINRVDDRPEGSGPSYRLTSTFSSAEGVYVGTPVQMAGIPIGSVDGVDLVEGQARLTLEMRGGTKLPVDSHATLVSESPILGDRVVRVIPGQATEVLEDGDVLLAQPLGEDIAEIQERISEISKDVKAITGAVRQTLENHPIEQQVAQTVENVEELTATLRDLAQANKEEVDAIAQNIRELTEALNRVVASTGSQVDQELEQIQQLTTDLQDIARKVNEGEGTIGQLVNETETIDEINSTVGEVGDAVRSITSLGVDIYYRGGVYFGSDPNQPGFTTNPYAGGSKNLVGLKLLPREDFWYVFELVDHPIGDVTYVERLYPETGFAYTEYERRPRFRYTLAFAKRYYNAVFRLGLIESSGGVGFDYYMWRDRIMFTSELYDFEFGSWPVLDGTPNLALRARFSPYPNVFLEGGVENVLLGARHGYTTGFVGAGFIFSDDDFKWLLTVLPTP